MQRYVIQLISDIEVAIQQAPPVSEYAVQGLFDFDPQDDGLMHVTDAQSVQLFELFGLHSLAFPPESRLNKSQITALLRAVERLWRAYQISWVFPHNLSARRRYVVMSEKMQTGSVMYSMVRGADIDFCVSKAECPFGKSGQCTCKEVEKTVDQDMMLWENLNRHIDHDENNSKPSDKEALKKWLDKDHDLPPWFIDEKNERWQSFQNNREDIEWLYFYRPDGADESKGLYPYELDDEPDYDDFEWDESAIHDDGLFPDDDEEDYFGDGDLPF